MWVRTLPFSESSFPNLGKDSFRHQRFRLFHTPIMSTKRAADIVTDRSVKPRLAAPAPSEDLEAAMVLKGLFASPQMKVLPQLNRTQLDGIIQIANARMGAPKPATAVAAAVAPIPVAPAAVAAPSAPAASKLQFCALRATLWDTVAKRRIPATAYDGDMAEHLARNPHLEMYNRQDRVNANKLLAGVRTSTFAATTAAAAASPSAEAAAQLKVMCWHTLEQRKLTRDEAPTQPQLCRFLAEHPHIEIYQGQQAKPAAAAAAAPEPPLKKPPTPTPAATTVQPAAAQLLQLAGVLVPAKPPLASTPKGGKKQGGLRWKSMMSLAPMPTPLKAA